MQLYTNKLNILNQYNELYLSDFAILADFHSSSEFLYEVLLTFTWRCLEGREEKKNTFENVYTNLWVEILSSFFIQLSLKVQTKQNKLKRKSGLRDQISKLAENNYTDILHFLFNLVWKCKQNKTKQMKT